ncbi:hypothetical protein DTO271G3_8568 [Paecilomyces variotii]|nr:hypothetical protein DTO271G3_8568 [Paecilomyces variotii]
MAPLCVTGKVRSRFLHAAVLLRTLDPVRGEPTIHDLDLNDVGQSRERLLKRKFLDSFALICAAEKGGDSVSAACLEEGQPQGTIIRIASNTGVKPTVVSQVRSIIDDLNSIASQESHKVDNQDDILLKIVQLDVARIQDYLRNVQDHRKKASYSRSDVSARILKSRPDTALSDLELFFEWLENVLADKPDTHSDLVRYIKIVQKAKRDYADLLSVAFSNDGQPTPRWVAVLYKLGRYAVASRVFVQLAVERPALFNPMTVEAILAPDKTPFSRNEISLDLVLRRLIGNREEEYRSRLSRVWAQTDVETYFREQFPTSLAVHAEMQLLGFYDHDPQKLPSFRFIGVSKKSCYLCDKFLAIHPKSFRVSACHQKLYVSWIPPHSADSRIYAGYRSLTTTLTKTMETVAMQDLLQRLGTPRRQVPADSSAGVSFTGLSMSGSIQTRTRVSITPAVDAVDLQRSRSENRGSGTCHVRQIEQLVRPAALASEETPSSRAVDDLSACDLTEDLSSSKESHPFSNMVFHFIRIDDFERQDIVHIDDILDLRTQRPSWEKLVTLLETDSDSGLSYRRQMDILMVNNRMLVSNERRLIACLQYLRNSGQLNIDVQVGSRSALSAQKAVLQKPEEVH